jgi:hypothetical protein
MSVTIRRNAVRLVGLLSLALVVSLSQDPRAARAAGHRAIGGQR